MTIPKINEICKILLFPTKVRKIFAKPLAVLINF